MGLRSRFQPIHSKLVESRRQRYGTRLAHHGSYIHKWSVLFQNEITIGSKQRALQRGVPAPPRSSRYVERFIQIVYLNVSHWLSGFLVQWKRPGLRIWSAEFDSPQDLCYVWFVTTPPLYFRIRAMRVAILIPCRYMWQRWPDRQLTRHVSLSTFTF